MDGQGRGGRRWSRSTRRSWLPRGYCLGVGGGGSGGIGRAVVDFFFVLFGVVEDFSFDSAASSVGVDRAPTDWFHFSVIVSLFF